MSEQQGSNSGAAGAQGAEASSPEGAAKKVALVSGATRGLGAALALELARDHHVIALGRTVGGLEELDDRIREIGGSATLAPMDITIEEAMAQLGQSIYQRWGRLDVWAHTAIYAAPLTPAAHLEQSDLQKSWEVNVLATARLMHMIAPLLEITEGAQALFFDDPRGGEGLFGYYGSSKAAQMAIVRSWQRETQRLGPRVQVLAPRPMPTAVRARFFPGEDRSALHAPAGEARRLLAEAGILAMPGEG